jgi:isopenicillin N synthase-like dioxygenase
MPNPFGFSKAAYRRFASIKNYPDIIFQLPCVSAAALPQRDQVLAELRKVARTHGLLYLDGHGHSAAAYRCGHLAVAAVFGLPERDKLEIAMRRSSHFRGWP